MKTALFLLFLGSICTQTLFAGSSSNSWVDNTITSINPICVDPISVILDKVSDVNHKGFKVEPEKSVPKSNHISITCVREANETNSRIGSDSFQNIRLKGDLTVVEFIDHFIPFLFRTKKSEELGKVDVIININRKGKLTDYELISDVDKGLKQRLNYVFRKMPDWKVKYDEGEDLSMDFLVSIALQ